MCEPVMENAHDTLVGDDVGTSTAIKRPAHHKTVYPKYTLVIHTEARVLHRVHAILRRHRLVKSSSISQYYACLLFIETESEDTYTLLTWIRTHRFLPLKISGVYPLPRLIRSRSGEEAVREACRSLAELHRPVRLMLLVYPRSKSSEVLRDIGEQLPEGCELCPRNHTHMLSMVFAFNRVDWALLDDEKQWRFTPSWEQEEEERRTCRAWYKLAEVFEAVLEPAVAAQFMAVNALDVGASPGGWTRYLAAERKCTVTAVDPGEIELTDDIASQVRVVHGAVPEEPVMREIDANGPYQLVVCDMNMPAVRAVHIIASVLRSDAVVNGALVVLTLKFWRTKMDGRQEEVLQELRGVCRDVELQWLLFNRKERTVTGIVSKT